MTRLIRAAALTLLLALPMACADDAAGTGPHGSSLPEVCVTQEDCNGADCINGVCTEQPCTSQEDCNGADCVNGFCSVHPCETQAECVLGGDCVNGLCLNGDGSKDASEDADLTDTAEDASMVPDATADAPPDVLTVDTEEGALFGEACVEDVECAAGFCVADGQARVCTEACVGDCPHDGFECALLEDADGAQHQLCMPADAGQCASCKDDTECGSPGALCVNFSDGLACAIACGPNGLCPLGARCETQTHGGESYPICLPVSGVCAGCVDGDGDGYGFGAQCLGFDCDDDDTSTHQDANEVCDGVDNDCDLEVDENFPHNVCGGCQALDDIPGNPCGPCGLDSLVCDEGGLRCDGDSACPAPTSVTASDGTRVDAVEVHWTGPAQATGYQVFRDDALIAEVAGDARSLDDAGAGPGDLPAAPTGLSASDGARVDRVDLTWTAATVEAGPAHAYTVVAVLGAFTSAAAVPDTGFRAGAPVLRYELSADDGPWLDLGLTLASNDPGAPAPTVVAGAAAASDGTSFTAVELALDAATASPGAAVSYRVRAVSASGEGAPSASDPGHRGVGPLAIQWRRSASDADADYTDLPGATSAPFEDTTAPADGVARFYLARVVADGASPALSAPDRGYRATPVCGNGVEEPGESCDDRNRDDDDGCNSLCQNEYCGDRIVQGGLLNEACDDGVNDGRYEGCRPGCQARGPYCGDGTPDPGEACDDGNPVDTDACANDCTANATLTDCGPVAATSNGLLGDIVLSGAATFDTDAGTLVDASGTVVAAGSPGVTTVSQPAIGPFAAPAITVFHFRSLVVPASVTVRITGARPLALLAAGDLQIAGSIELAGASGGSGATNAAGTAGGRGAGGWTGGAFVSGPGCAAGNGLADGPGRGNEGGCGTRGGDGGDASGSGGGGGGGGSCGGSGGAGAGYAAAGGDGANGNPGTDGGVGASSGGAGGTPCDGPPLGSAGGPAVGDPTLTVLVGGSGGSSGGFGALGGFGGDGGDTGTGWGGFGGLGGQSGGGGGGGGGGGALLLCAAGTLEVSGSLDAHGGSGGGGGGADTASNGDNGSATGSDPRGGGGGAGRSGGGGGGGGGAGGALFLRANTVRLLGTARLNAGGGAGGFAGFSGGGGFGGVGRSGGGSGGRGGDGGRGGAGGDGSDGTVRVEASELLNSAIIDGAFVPAGL